MILIINPSKKLTKSMSEMFYYMGILSYGATPPEALSEISELYRAAIIISPEVFPDILDYVKRLKSYKSDIPVFAISDEENNGKFDECFDKVFSNKIFSPALAKKIATYITEEGLARIGDYRLAGIDSSANQWITSFYYRPVELTRTESMILRFLIRSYPLPMSAEKILKYAFKPSRTPEPASIRTHISIINKKFEKCSQRKIITSIPGSGYIIATPEYLAKQKNR